MQTSQGEKYLSKKKERAGEVMQICKNSFKEESCINFSEEGKSREDGLHKVFFFSHVTLLPAELCKLFIVVKGLGSIYTFLNKQNAAVQKVEVPK